MANRSFWANCKDLLVAIRQYCSVTIESSVLRRRILKELAVSLIKKPSCAMTLCPRHHKREMTALRLISLAFVLMLVPATKREKSYKTAARIACICISAQPTRYAVLLASKPRAKDLTSSLPSTPILIQRKSLYPCYELHDLQKYHVLIAQ